MKKAICNCSKSTKWALFVIGILFLGILIVLNVFDKKMPRPIDPMHS